MVFNLQQREREVILYWKLGSDSVVYVRMLTPYDLRLVPQFPDLRFSRSVLDLFTVAVTL